MDVSKAKERIKRNQIVFEVLNKREKMSTNKLKNKKQYYAVCLRSGGKLKESLSSEIRANCLSAFE